MSGDDNMRKKVLISIIVLIFLALIIYISIEINKYGTYNTSNTSKHWKAETTYTISIASINIDSTLYYLDDNPPKEIDYDLYFSEVFPFDGSGKIINYGDGIIYQVGGGSGENYPKLDAKTIRPYLKESYILVKWEGTEGFIEEKVYLMKE